MSSLIWLLAVIAFVGNGPDRKIVYFRMESCPACKLVQPAIEELNADGWTIRSVDIVKDPKTAERWGVAEIPTLIVLEAGQEVERIVGSLDHAELKRRLVGTELSARQKETPPSRKRKPAQARDNSTIGANFPPKESIAGPNHPSNRPIEDLDDPFAMFGENHPFFYSKKKLQPGSPLLRTPQPPVKDAAKPSARPARPKNYLPPGVKLPELPETMAATVRIRIKYEGSESVGTGTIIDIERDELLVLTCGHLFHDDGEERRIFVELFREGKVIEVPATLVDYRNDELDLGFVKFRQSPVDVPIPKIPILPKGQTLHEQDLVFSIGCDGGEPPSRRDTVISRLNRFIGPSNIEIAGAPVQGRSGGGLFDVRGRLVGVCIAADNESDEGLYVGPEAIYGQLEKLGLRRLFE